MSHSISVSRKSATGPALAAALALASGCAFSRGASPDNSGLVYGESYAFLVSAPRGWVLDNQTGASNGLQAVFYPEGSSWQNASAIMYVNVAQRKAKDELDSFITADLEKFRKGSQDLQATPGVAIETADKKLAQVRHLSGDEWGNSEAVAYVQENTVFVMIVLSGRTLPSYQAALPAFTELVKSYKLMTEEVRVRK